MRLKSWDEQFSTEETNRVSKELALWHLAQTSESPAREYIAACISSDNLSRLCDFDLDVRPLNPVDAYHLSQVLAFYRKRQDLDLGIDKEGVAYAKFQEAERVCAETNEVFRKASCGGFNFPPHVCGKLFAAQRKIASCLGDFPGLERLKMRFGPGASTYVKKQEASARLKLSSRFTCSEDLIPLLPGILGEMPAWIPFTEDSDVALVDVDIVYGRLSFVPKNCKTDRAIVVEPLLNQMYQLGVGDHIACRLRKFGIDISDQTRNQRCAREGSITGELATLDLSSASDTIAYELVKSLVPFDWFEALRYGRSSSVTYNSSLIRLEKFSSMGNGFTFPLETLIFWGLASSCVKDADAHRVSVYGDDIIIPTYAYADVCELLQICGFEVNTKKSFASGPFRESCGKDYLSGIDIRPVFIKDRLLAADLFVLHNYYMRQYLREPAAILLSYLSDSIKLFGPDGYGDGHLVGYPEKTQRACKPHNRGLGWAGYTFETFTWKSRKSYAAQPGDYVYPSYSIYVRDSSGLPGPRELRCYIRSRGNLDMGDNPRVLRQLQTFSATTPVATYKKVDDGCVLTNVLPGTRGYKRVKIYTLNV